jgi:hypothetical protein
LRSLARFCCYIDKDVASRMRANTLDAPISATAILAEIAEEMVRTVLAQHPGEKIISLLAISVSHLRQPIELQLELPLGLRDEGRRPGSRKGIARWAADRAVDKIRARFGWGAVRYGSVAFGPTSSVPTSFVLWPSGSYDPCLNWPCVPKRPCLHKSELAQIGSVGVTATPTRRNLSMAAFEGETDVRRKRPFFTFVPTTDILRV